MIQRAHATYVALAEKVAACHERGRDPSGLTESDISVARLYSYGFRLHTIGAYHATRVALLARPPSNVLAVSHRTRAAELLEDLANQAMEPVPDDFRAALSTFHRYHRGVERTLAALGADSEASRDGEIIAIRDRFAAAVEAIVSHNGIHLTRDDAPQPQASFVVPNLGITIAPLVYGEHHSWNIAWLDPAQSNVPAHQHHRGVEIHLGYSPMKGYTILGDCATEVTEGYAMPIPPMTRHGYTNVGPMGHHVPFIFGSLHHGGWGVFLDVEAKPTKLSDLRIVPRDAAAFRQTIFLEREIAAAARAPAGTRRVLIPAAVTDRDNSGGLELSVSKVGQRPMEIRARDGFLAVSVVRGSGSVTMAGSKREISVHDHFGIPAGMTATLQQSGAEPMVILDTAIKLRYRRAT